MHKSDIKSVLIDGETHQADEYGNVTVPDEAVNRLLNAGYVVGHLIPSAANDSNPEAATATPAATAQPTVEAAPIAAKPIEKPAEPVAVVIAEKPPETPVSAVGSDEVTVPLPKKKN
jgi:hypothetical protein